MKWTDTPSSIIIGATQLFWDALGDNADTVATAINTNPGFVTWLAAFAVNPGFAVKSRTSSNEQWLRARGIMGHNFFGVEEAIKHFGVNPSKRQLAALAEIPWSEEVLQSVKDTHILVAVFPVSILDIRGKVECNYLFYSQEEIWYNDQAFAKDRGEVGWQLVQKTPIKDSTSKTWDEQQELLDENEKTPSAQVMVYTIIGYFKVTGERLFENIYVRCSDLDSDGLRVNTGDFSTKGLLINSNGDGSWNYNRDDDLGLASARKELILLKH